MPTEQQLQKAIQAGYTPQQIKLAVARSGQTQRQNTTPTGLSGWLTGGESGFKGFATGVGNALNLPSYAIGGLLNQGQRAFGSKYGQETDATGLGILEGIKNKRGLFTEAPETFGVDPNSGMGKIIGFGAELLVPTPPIGKLTKFAKFGKAADEASDVVKLSGKFGAIGKDAARTLLEKSYRLSASDIQKIAEAIGVTDESQKAIKVIDYLEGLGLKGSNRGSLRTLNAVTEGAQKPFNSLARSGGQVSRQPFIDQLLQSAIEAEKMDTPASRLLSEKLFKEAYQQSLAVGKPLTDTDLTNKISRLFGEAGQSAISDPASANFSKALAKSGQGAREILRPGTTEMGRQLRGLRTAQEVIGKKANTGLGTQLVNTFKPSAAGFGIGAVAGYSSGQNPLLSGLVGTVGGIAVNNPRVMNAAGKALMGGVKLPAITNKYVSTGLNIGKEALKRTPVTAFRLSTMPNGRESLQGSQLQRTIEQPVKRKTYPPSVSQPRFVTTQINYKAPANPFKNKSSFGKTKKIKAGAFN